ncbi:MAG: hypothetical protein AAFY60_17500, partial [Myxococcota bacterium]
DCVANTGDSTYCDGWVGCAGSLTVNQDTVNPTATLCEERCSEENCVNGTCSPQDDGGTQCLCFGGFEGENCETVTDLCPGDPDKTAPGACGCGVADTDSDEDQTPDCLDACPNDSLKTAAGVCGCGVSDTDSDSDGTADCQDACAADMNKTEAGVCGCGVADTDSDQDQTADCLDLCPDDPMKTAPGECGCGETEDSCVAACPCFDGSFVARLANGLESGCRIGWQGETYISNSAQGGFVDASETFVYAVAEARELYDGGGFECTVDCGQESPECTPVLQSISEADHDACVALIVAEPACE